MARSAKRLHARPADSGNVLPEERDKRTKHKSYALSRNERKNENKNENKYRSSVIGKVSTLMMCDGWHDTMRERRCMYEGTYPAIGAGRQGSFDGV